jgi:hypothetical protein
MDGVGSDIDDGYLCHKMIVCYQMFAIAIKFDS